MCENDFKYFIENSLYSYYDSVYIYILSSFQYYNLQVNNDNVMRVRGAAVVWNPCCLFIAFTVFKNQQNVNGLPPGALNSLQYDYNAACV